MIKLHKSKDKQFYFTVQARNGKVLVTSETYRSKASARKAIHALEDLMCLSYLPIVDLTKSKQNGK